MEDNPGTEHDNPPAAHPPGHMKSSPWIPVPDQKIFCIEHPAVIQNLDKGVTTLGGRETLARMAVSNGNMPLHLRFRPDDPMQIPIESRSVPTNNLLVKVMIPRRRKKRKQADGNDQMDEDTPSEPVPGDNLRDKLRNSKGKYKLEVVGTVSATVRFRDMASFQWNTSRSPFVTKMKDTISTCTYESISNFELSTEKGNPHAEILPPPTFSNTVVPHTYNYRQNPAVKRALIDGKTALLNFQAAPKTLTPMVHTSQATTPSKPADVPAYEELDALQKECVDHLRVLFDKRPIWTRRALYNNFPKHLQTLVRFTMCHVAYMWRAGPWRDTCVRYGIDPRKDPQYRIYQSVFFQIETSKSRTAYPTGNSQHKNSHIFDGQRLIRDGRCFQLCDVTDPLVQSLINTDKIRKTYDPVDGWYRFSTMSKIKAIMKAKILAMSEGKPLLDSDYISILEQESEDESQEAVRKAKDAEEKGARSEKRRAGVRNLRHPELKGKPQQDSPEAAGDDEEKDEAEVEDEEADGEWDQELDLPSSANQIDNRVQQMMQHLMNQNDNDFDVEEDEDEGDFDILGEDDE